MIMDHTNIPFFSHKIQVSNERTPPELYKEKKKCKYNEIVIYREINLILTQGHFSYSVQGFHIS